MQIALSRIFVLLVLLASGLLAGCGGSCLGCGGDGGSEAGTPPPVGAPPAPPPPPTVFQSFAYVAASGLESVAIYRIEDDGTLVSIETVLAGENMRSLAVHPSNRFAYAVNGSDDNISAYALDPSTGRLSNRVNIPTGRAPRLMRIHPSGNFAYVTNYGDGTVSIFDIDTSTGALTVNPASPVAVGADTSGIMIDPTGRFIFLESADGVRSYSIAASGALSANSTVPMAVALDDIALALSGKLLYVAAANGTVSMHSISPTGQVGSGTVLTVGGIGEQSIYVEPRGRFAYVTNLGDDTVAAFGIQPETGELNYAGTVSPGPDPRSVAMGPTGQFLYATSEDGGTITTYAVDQTTGALSAVGTPIPADFLPVWITVASFPR